MGTPHVRWREIHQSERDCVIEVMAVGEIHRRGAARLITALMGEWGLHVVQGQGVTSIQTVRGFQRRIGTAAWYAINKGGHSPISQARVRQVRQHCTVYTSCSHSRPSRPDCLSSA